MAETEVIVEPDRQDIVVTAVFDAPREVVFEAYTDPGLIPKWWGSRQFATEVELMEVRPGGRWRYLVRRDDGTVYGFKGVYHDVVPPEKIISTLEFEPGGPGHLQLTTAELDEIDGRTRLVTVSLFQSVEDRDGWIPPGMDEAIAESMDQLAELLQP